MKVWSCFFPICVCLSVVLCSVQTQNQPSSFPICGGMSCKDCIPLERQTAPGIGLDLSLNYGTAAIHFQNGTTCDIPLVQADSIYQATMRDLVLEAKLLSTGHEGNLPVVNYLRDSNIISQSILQRVLPAAVFSALKRMVCPKPEITTGQDQWVNALAGMLEALKMQIESVHGIRNSMIWLSVPDFIWNVEAVMQRFRQAAIQAGVAVDRHQLQGLAAMRELHGIDHCWDDCQDDQRHPNVLVADLSNQTLGLSLYTRWQGMLETKLVQQEYYFSPHSYIISYNGRLQNEDDSCFEGLIQRFLLHISDPIHRVVLTGSGATDPFFLSALRAVFSSRNDIEEQNYLRDAQSHTFASARQGARQSRLSNMGAFLGCEMPERCFRGKEGEVRMNIYNQVNKELYEAKSEL